MKLQPVTTSITMPVNFLASDHFQVLPEGLTIDASKVTADEDTGKKILLAGTEMAVVTSSGLAAPFDKDAHNGQEVGIGLLMYDIDVTNGNDVCGILVHGLVKTGAIPTPTAEFKACVGGAIIYC